MYKTFILLVAGLYSSDTGGDITMCGVAGSNGGITMLILGSLLLAVVAFRLFDELYFRADAAST